MHPPAQQSLSDKVVVVTGAGAGIGRILALALAQAGARVAVTDRTLADAEQVRNDILTADGTAIAVPIDITERQSIAAGLDGVIANWGRIDVMVNNAGISEEKPFLEITADDLDRTMHVNGLGTLLCMQEAAHRMKERGGKIINVTSITGKQANATFAHYAASKAAINSLIQSGARSLAPGITVMGLAPGIVETPLWSGLVADYEARETRMSEYASRILLERVSVPEDLAGAAVFLAGDGSDYMTGHILTVDGGLVLI